jgi:hypothetical protein
MVISKARLSVPSATHVNSAFSSIDDGISYVSLAPRTLPNAVRVQIANRKRNAPATIVPVIDGGFDPVAIQASVGDTLDFVAFGADGSNQPMAVRVPAKRPPSVVRTKPAKGLTDVALIVVVTVVFTEPIVLRTVDASSLQLMHGEIRVPGKIVSADNTWDVQFVPDAPLEANSAYQLVVSTNIRDLDGDPLDQSYNSSFVTGIRLCDGKVVGSGCEALPLRGDNVISGSVVARSRMQRWPVPNATISPWIQLDDGRAYTLPPIQADANGKYTLSSLPEGIVQLHATSNGLDQPCGVVARSSKPGTTADIEMFASGETAINQESSVELIGTMVTMPDERSGRVVPLPGVRISLESPENFVMATSTSDADGNFDLCRLSLFGQRIISASKPGYGTLRTSLPLQAGTTWATLRLWLTP